MRKFFFIFLLFPLFSHAQIIKTIVGGVSAGFGGDGGPATAGILNSPYGVALDDDGNLYICDKSNNRVRKVNITGIISTVAGSGTLGYFGDGSLATNAQISAPLNVAIDHKGNLYIADAGNNRIRKVAGGIISTVAGTGVAGFNGDGIAATLAMLNQPVGLAVDDAGSIYIGDALNYRIRKIDTFGVIHSIAGTGVSGFSSDGAAADTSQIHHCISLKVDHEGNIFFVDSSRIRRINSFGILSTVAGITIMGYGGDGGIATSAMIYPEAIDVDVAGNIYVADGSNQRIRKVTTDGYINTIAGNGMVGLSGDGGDPLLAQLCHPAGIAVNTVNDIYFSNQCGASVRKITILGDGVLSSLSSDKNTVRIFPNPTDGKFSLQITTQVMGNAKVILSNIHGAILDELSVPSNELVSIETCQIPGVYVVSVHVGCEHYSEKLIVR